MNLEEFLKKQAQAFQQIPDDFISQVSIAEREIYERILELLSMMEKEDGYIVMSKKNLKIADEIRDALPGIIEDSTYSDAIAAFVKELDKHKGEIGKYIKGEFGKVKTGFADAVYEQTKRNAVELLVSSTVTTNFLNTVSSQIETAVQTGQRFKDTIDQIRELSKGSEDNPGKLVQYSKQIAYDAVAISDRSYTNAIANEIGAVWYLYAGGLLPTSRSFCEERVGNYYHAKEIESWASLKWSGKMENTTKETIFKVLGGYRCEHVLIPVTIEMVPDEVVQRNIESGNYKKAA